MNDSHSVRRRIDPSWRMTDEVRATVTLHFKSRAATAMHSSNHNHGKNFKPDAVRANTLGLNKVDLDTVLDDLDAKAVKADNPRRQSARLEFRLPSIRLEIVQPGGGQTQITVACRNLSRTGLGFLHSSYMHPGTTVVAIMPHKTLGLIRVPGQVMRCRHVTRHIHEVGVQFKTPLNLRDFVEMDTFSQAFSSETVDPSQLAGILLIVAEYKIEQACIQSMLRETSMDFVSASSVEEGVNAALKGVDIIICDQTFETGSGIDFVHMARSKGIRCPILIMSADQSPEARGAIRAANASGYISKPIDQRMLLRAMAEFLLLSGTRDTDSHQLFSSLPTNSPLSDLADEFVGDLRTCADEVEKLAQANDADGVRKRVLRVVGAAPALGFEPVAKLGAAFLKSLASTMSLDESLMPLNAFLSTCRSVRKRGGGDTSKSKSA
jgi:CheY-like chemotaxis protein